MRWPTNGNMCRCGALALFIESSLYQGTQWVVFEPNDEPLWSAIRLNIGSFMQNLFLQGAFQGQTPDAGVFREVRQRNHDADRHRQRHRQHPGRLCAAEPAEFVVIQIQQMAGQTRQAQTSRLGDKSNRMAEFTVNPTPPRSL